MKTRRDRPPAKTSPALLFRRGLEALNAGFPSRAVGYFRSAASSEGQAPTSVAGLRALSYYGLSLALAEGPSHEALEACERAAALGGSDSDLCANLGWVYLLAGRRTTALSALECARELNPRSQRLRSLLSPDKPSAVSSPLRPSRRPLPHRSIRRLPASPTPAGA
jgi:Flp pilus assembly protein TadD